MIWHGEPVARVTGNLGSLPAPFFGCDAETLQIFVIVHSMHTDLRLASGGARGRWSVCGFGGGRWGIAG